jgi:NAD(P)-dependent dehydrogenase (short-subunit alcohol dehydrogenase family)
MSFDPSSAFGLADRVALVTGSSRGLGRAIAEGFAGAGAHVVIASRDGAACAQVATQIEARTGRAALPYAVHVGHWDELEPMIDAVYERFGRLDVLVNNAGMSPLYDSVQSVSEELFDKVINVNLKGPFRLAAVAGERMAKAGLNALTVGLAHAFGPAVRCNAIVAGTFLTDVSKSWDAGAFDARAAGFALRRGGEPDEIVGAALYLASAASSYTTGSLLTVDGGQP